MLQAHIKIGDPGADEVGVNLCAGGQKFSGRCSLRAIELADENLVLPAAVLDIALVTFAAENLAAAIVHARAVKARFVHQGFKLGFGQCGGISVRSCRVIERDQLFVIPPAHAIGCVDGVVDLVQARQKRPLVVDVNVPNFLNDMTSQHNDLVHVFVVVASGLGISQHAASADLAVDVSLWSNRLLDVEQRAFVLAADLGSKRAR